MIQVTGWKKDTRSNHPLCSEQCYKWCIEIEIERERERERERDSLTFKTSLIYTISQHITELIHKIKPTKPWSAILPERKKERNMMVLLRYHTPRNYNKHKNHVTQEKKKEKKKQYIKTMVFICGKKKLQQNSTKSIMAVPFLDILLLTQYYNMPSCLNK